MSFLIIQRPKSQTISYTPQVQIDKRSNKADYIKSKSLFFFPEKCICVLADRIKSIKFFKKVYIFFQVLMVSPFIVTTF